MSRAQIHKFYLNDQYVVLDVNSGAVHIIDKIVYDVLDYYKDQSLENIISKFDGIYDKKDIEEVYEEITYLVDEDMLYTEENDLGDIVYNEENIVKAMCLHIAHDCREASIEVFSKELWQ